MHQIVIILAGVLLLLVPIVLLLSRQGAFAQIVGAIGLLGIFLFCAFGFLASFEPSATSNVPWKLGYAALGLFCLCGASLLLKRTLSQMGKSR